MTTLIVECIYCGDRKELIGPVPEMPMCEKDGGVMIAVSARTDFTKL